MQRCVDENNHVVDDSLCDSQPNQHPAAGTSAYPILLPFHYYYGGWGGYGIGSVVGGGSTTPIRLNIFGGITRCDEVARGIITAIAEVQPKVPMVVRLVGTNAEEGRQILASANLITAETLADAAQKAVAAAKGE